MSDAIERTLEQQKDKILEIGLIVVDEAYLRFCTCGAESDFCIQSVGAFTAVFGGTNRVVWRPAYGFRPDRPYCTARFLKEWDSNYGETA